MESEHSNTTAWLILLAFITCLAFWHVINRGKKAKPREKDKLSILLDAAAKEFPVGTDVGYLGVKGWIIGHTPYDDGFPDEWSQPGELTIRYVDNVGGLHDIVITVDGEEPMPTRLMGTKEDSSLS